jgi:hypothetical protein
MAGYVGCCSTAAANASNEEIVPCVWIMGFGIPVEPEVWRTMKGSALATAKVFTKG